MFDGPQWRLTCRLLKERCSEMAGVRGAKVKKAMGKVILRGAVDASDGAKGKARNSTGYALYSYL